MVKKMSNILILTFTKYFQITEKWLQLETVETESSLVLASLIVIQAEYDFPAT